MIEPRYSNLNAMPLAWSDPTGTPLTADVVLAPFNATPNQQKKTEEDFAKYTRQWHDKLKGKIVLFRCPAAGTLGESALHGATPTNIGQYGQSARAVN